MASSSDNTHSLHPLNSLQDDPRALHALTEAPTTPAELVRADTTTVSKKRRLGKGHHEFVDNGKSRRTAEEVSSTLLNAYTSYHFRSSKTPVQVTNASPLELVYPVSRNGQKVR